MCGLAGSFRTDDRPQALPVAALREMGRRLEHRGPDGEGVFRDDRIALVHRRLVVVDRSDAGAQPMATPDGSAVIAYNGELYNDAELRDELEAEGVRFGSACDTETVLWALARWGEAALARFRGMYALAFYEPERNRLLLARDALGIKPLYVAGLSGEVVFASEPHAVLAHPAVSAAPDEVAVSAYLSAVRVTIGSRTLFEGIESLGPGESRVYEAGRAFVRGHVPAVRPVGASQDEQRSTRAVVTDSILRHLRSDVPLCALLSGGLDSSIVTSVAHGMLGRLKTFCSGDAAGGPDFEHASIVAEHVGSEHTAVPVSRGLFAERWRWLVGESRLPLCTPNEVAIYEVARALRDAGQVVTLSGEGADELFGGYVAPIESAARHIAAGNHDAGAYQYDAHAWVPRAVKDGMLEPGLWRRVDRDSEAVGWYRREWEGAAAEPGAGDALEAHLRLHRRVNLTRLLRRLDSATMRASVEGRTPLADVEVASHAGSIRVSEKCSFEACPSGASGGGGGVVGTKLPLRSAFSGDLPAAVVGRAKQSFPLPFEAWVGDAAGLIRGSLYLRSVFRDEAIELVAADPPAAWSAAWPMANLALWAEANGFG
ncbi:MAG: asparagine synthase (glutamine-hydrolyzing) [Planctomycetota bacterium]